MKNLIIERNDYSKLSHCMSAVGITTNDQMTKRMMMSLNLRLRRAMIKCSREFIIKPSEATAISEALELLYNKTFKEIMSEDVTKKK